MGRLFTAAKQHLTPVVGIYIKDEGKEKAIRYYRILAGVLGILGAALLALGIGAAVEQSNYAGEDTFGMPYFVGGFLVGILSLTSAAICTCVLVKAPDATSDVKKKELACAMVGHYILSVFMIVGCLIGTILAGVGAFAGSWYFDEKDEYYYTKQKLAIAILVLCGISLLVTICSLCVVCIYGSYFGVVITNRRGGTVIMVNAIGTGGTNIVHPAPYPMGSFANNDQIRQLEMQNRLLQQQLELQRQLNPHHGGFYPPPTNYGFGVGSSVPPPSYNSLN